MKGLKLKQNEVVHCPTKELAKEVLRVADDLGYVWKDMNSFLIYTKYGVYKEKTCYNINQGKFNCVSYYTDNNFQIITAEEFLQRHETPTSDLTFPRVMEVSDDGRDWYNRVVFYYDPVIKKHLSYSGFNNINELDKAIHDNKSIYISIWNHTREIPETINLTKQEIADKLGIDVNFLNITD